MQDVNWTALIIFLVLFALITWLGFAAAHWRKGDLDLLHEWGLGGRRFGTVITWFLIGGDLYTAYTFIAVPALAFGAGAVAFFAVPYTIVAYPILFLVFPRLWYVCHRHNYITAADFVRGRFGNRWLALAMAVTGIVATLPYIALQLVGLQVVIGGMGVSGEGYAGDLPLLFAFIILAAFTYSSGLRAPASIAIVKDILIYITAFAAVIVVPIQLDGFANIFAAVPAQKLLLAAPGANTTGAYGSYATLALGSALALFLYPHSITGILSASSGHAVRRNAALLPAYSFMLGLLALVGFFAIAAGVGNLPEYAAGFKQFGNNFAVPALFLHSFPSWFVGIAFAAVGIGALVPAAIMSIAAANLYTRNIHREFINGAPTDRQEAQMAKWVSLIVKFGALAFIVFVPSKYAIYLQLLGGIWIIQTLPAVMLGVYTRWFNDWALLTGWAAGIVAGTAMFVAANLTPTYALAVGAFTFPGYSALYAVVLNLVLTLVLTPLFNLMSGASADETLAAEYRAPSRT
ncbi:MULTISPECIES: sodium:solute symporter [unclassified Bradyrhizobium]|uniref:monocarboxylate uptake permease MctP n=1 Tax=unclassified Bradyrhizobium TaxID=2631580 RepID=UPI002478E770|nr:MULTISPECIES: sodium:solute symporter [unclassified Bradyrhizobium]WGR72051.1 sodium:solute symporter [Bradyrhizobium sp. ISRA426]WGR76885.1 sodium:solute symporter [Bradyrhizobium sp. ISRA430]WGR87290.1 sodium:solute symporter [Bradyrhizobium sp. ISRA432]